MFVSVSKTVKGGKIGWIHDEATVNREGIFCLMLTYAKEVFAYKVHQTRGVIRNADNLWSLLNAAITELKGQNAKTIQQLSYKYMFYVFMFFVVHL